MAGSPGTSSVTELERSVQKLGQPGAAFALLAAVQTTLILAITVISIALPAIQDRFDLHQGELVLVSAAYGLSFSGLLLLGGRLTDVFGRRRALVMGLVVFGTASAAGGLAQNVTSLLIARFAQGCGAALAAPAAMALLGTVFPEPERRIRALARCVRRDSAVRRDDDMGLLALGVRRPGRRRGHGSGHRTPTAP